MNLHPEINQNKAKKKKKKNNKKKTTKDAVKTFCT